jgi:hypothetical protein
MNSDEKDDFDGYFGENVRLWRLWASAANAIS